MNAFLNTSIVLGVVLLGLAATVLVIYIPGRLILDRLAIREELKRWTDDHIAEVADVAAQEEAFAVKNALAALDEVAALLADPDVAVKLALLAEGRAA
jgi:hypothetical protein